MDLFLIITIIKKNQAETAPLAGQISTEEARDALLEEFIHWLRGPNLDTPYSKATIRADSRWARRFLAFAAFHALERLRIHLFALTSRRKRKRRVAPPPES